MKSLSIRHRPFLLFLSATHGMPQVASPTTIKITHRNLDEKNAKIAESEIKDFPWLCPLAPSQHSSGKI